MYFEKGLFVIDTEIKSKKKKRNHTKTGIAIEINANNGIFNRFCHITIGSFSRSRKSMILRLATTAGCGVKNSQPT